MCVLRIFSKSNLIAKAYSTLANSQCPLQRTTRTRVTRTYDPQSAREHLPSYGCPTHRLWTSRPPPHVRQRSRHPFSMRGLEHCESQQRGSAVWMPRTLSGTLAGRSPPFDKGHKARVRPIPLRPSLNPPFKVHLWTTLSRVNYSPKRLPTALREAALALLCAGTFCSLAPCHSLLVLVLPGRPFATARTVDGKRKQHIYASRSCTSRPIL